MIIRWLYRHNEALIWITALLWLYCMDSFIETRNGFCLLRFAGLDDCPGCGLGRSIHHALHLRWELSWQFHKLGIPALILIGHRIYSLTIPTKPTFHAKLPDEPA